jgi:peptidoglycan hydrolase CwlO-like protein
MHRRRIVVTTLLVVATLLTGPAASRAAPPSLSSAKAQANSLQAEIGVLDGRMKAAGGRYTVARQELALVQARIAANENQLSAAARELALERRRLAERAVACYKAPSTELLDVVLESRTFSELANGVDLMTRINKEGAALVDQLAQTKRGIARRQAQLVSDRVQAAALVSRVAEEEGQIKAVLQQRQTMLRNAQVKVKHILAQIAAAREAAARAAARAAAARAAAQLPVGVSPGSVAGGYSPASWAHDLLKDAHFPQTRANQAAIVAWEMAEGGHWYNGATYNPLNTTMPEPGATSMNSVGVKAYTSWSQGFTATLATLFNGNYAGIIAALRRGTSGQAVANAVAASPWGTQPFIVP